VYCVRYMIFIVHGTTIAMLVHRCACVDVCVGERNRERERARK